jgi:hypothetical protein
MQWQTIDEAKAKDKIERSGCPREPTSPEQAHWNEVGELVVDYFVLQAGVHDSWTLRQGFIAWLESSPDRLSVYMHGNVYSRLPLVDQYLEQVFLSR